MTTRGISAGTAVVTGASRGFGRAIAVALAKAGADVVGVSRDATRLGELQAELGPGFTPVTADAADPVTAGHLIDRYRPNVLVLNAGASPLARPLPQHTWQTFSRSWEVDVQHAFNWTREALLLPLDPGSVVIAMSSGAAVNGSPLSGGYAGAKAAIRFLTRYAADESERAGLGIRFISLLPRLTPATELGAAAAAAYAARAGQDLAAYLEQTGPALAVEQVGQAVLELAGEAGNHQDAYLLTAAGLSPLK
jgi:NAD(P)-dependent dehydrogenase (short-subunit alcohol dehydrogenase family)